jgi:hypothetical protein
MTNIKSGQIAIMLILVLLVLTTITTAVVAIAFSTSRDTTTTSLGSSAYAIASSGAENAILQLLRNSNYVGESNLSVGDGSVTIIVTTNGTIKTILSTATVNNVVRSVSVDASLINGQLNVLSWQEI